jgi:MFS family permease
MREPIRLTQPEYPSELRAWLTVAMLYVAYMTAFIDRQIIAFLVRPIREDFEISDFQFSLVSGLAFVIFYGTLGIPIGKLADHGPRVKIVGAGIAMWSLMTAACGLANSFVQLFLARLGVGVGEASLAPTAISLIADSFPPEKRAVPINVYAAGAHAGISLANIFGGLVVGFAVAGGIVTLPLLGEFKPWQLTFLIVGTPGLLLSLLFMFLREPVRHERVAMTRTSFRATLAFMRRHLVLFACLIGGSAVSSAASYGMYAWVPALLERTFGWSSTRIGLTFGLGTLVFGTAGLVLSAMAATHLSTRKVRAAPVRLMIFSLLGAITPAIALGWTEQPQAALPCIFAIVFFLGTPIGLTQVALQAVTPNEMRAQVIAVYLLAVAVMGLGIGPSLMAAVTDFVFGFDAALIYSMSIVVTIACVLSAGIMLGCVRPYAALADRLGR